MNKLRIIFFGTPDFAVPTLKALKMADFCNIKAVVTQPDKPIGRHHSQPVPSPIKQAAKGLKLPVLESLEGLKEVEADLGVVVAYGEILPQWVLAKFPLGIVNIHPSLLPKYRGSSPIQAAILNRDKETGVTLIKLDNQMDHGPIVAQEKYPLPTSPPPSNSPLSKGGEHKKRENRSAASSSLPLLRGGPGWGLTAGELHNQLAEIGARMLIKYLPDYIAGKIELKPQDDNLATYTKKLTKADGKIDWTKSAEEIEAHIRAMNPWPGAWTMWRGKRFVIWKASTPPPTPSSKRRGIILEEVQLEGKKKMPFAEFAKGHPGF